MKDNKYNLWVNCELMNRGESFFNDVDASNTVDGKPVCYWVNQQDRTVFSNAGYVVLVRCSNITVQGLNLTHNGEGVLLVETNNSTVTGNYIAENHNGVALYSNFSPCTNNTVSQNLIKQNEQDIFTFFFSDYLNAIDDKTIEKSVNTIGENNVDVIIPNPNPSPSSIPKSSPTSSTSSSQTRLTSSSPEITLEPTPTAHEIEAENFSPEIIIIALAAVAVIIGVLVFLARHKGRK
jgi:parallel beta-helix repeat protein